MTYSVPGDSDSGVPQRTNWSGMHTRPEHVPGIAMPALSIDCLIVAVYAFPRCRAIRGGVPHAWAMSLPGLALAHTGTIRRRPLKL
jgi:hypothetical protein